ncbi:hypothetical protein BIZ92_15165 [Achromobacter xylosoxidans]|uniref:Uncharacterized protein n=1 Tax=Alcaligenes xylosoxydans xylosoxydans TaxID=85698 RepID=A0A1R1JME7_ALCXX|nr:hypothetical protein BIZ92_15165 [Achromobacter xylosoxidans]
MTAFGAQAMELTKAQFENGLQTYIKEVPQCAAGKLAAGVAVSGGWYYQWKNRSELDVRISAEGNRIQRIEITAAGRDNNALQDIMCATIALMRATQPEYVTTSDAVRDAKHLWENAGSKPFIKAFFFDTFVAQMAPLLLTVK